MDTETPWVECPLALVTLIPTRREDKLTTAPDFDRFIGLGIVRAERFGPVDSLITYVRHHSFTVPDEAELAIIRSEDYKLRAPYMAQLLDRIAEIVEGAVPVAINPQLAKSLLQREFARAERESGRTIPRKGLFALRPKSRWINLGHWRRNSADPLQWPGMYSPMVDRLAAMLERLDWYTHRSVACPVRDTWTLGELMDWQEGGGG
jgi:hypothetical protein